MGWESYSKLLRCTCQIRCMLVFKSSDLRNFHAWVEVNRDIQIRYHLPENIVFWLVVVQQRIYTPIYQLNVISRYRLCYDFSSFHQRASSSCRTVVSLHPCSTTLIDYAVCFIIIPFTYTCLPFVFRRMYFIHATYMPIFYLLITCHASMACLYINCL